MKPRSSRRTFLHTSSLTALTASSWTGWTAGQAATPIPRGSSDRRPLVVASANGHQFKNGGPRTCVEEVWERLARGTDVLEAVVEGLQIVELDPAEDSVGYGGLPNAEGVVQLDACVMHGTKRRAGGVAALEGVRTPARVAQAVADLTDHHLLVGRGAQEFARQLGLPIEPDLNTDNSRRKWLEWKRRVDPEHWLDPRRREAAAERARQSMIADGLLAPDRIYGTIHCHALGPKGEIAGATTTSGLAWKIPGRVGDSPILGAGNWVDAEAGAGIAKKLVLTSHLQYRMHLRSVTLDDVRATLRAMTAALRDAPRAAQDLAHGEKVRYEDPRTHLIIVVQVAGRDTLRLITTFWRGVPDPQPVPAQTCKL